MVRDKLRNYVSQLALIAFTARCTGLVGIHKECLSAFRRACGRAKTAATEAGYMLGPGRVVDSKDTSNGVDR